MPPALYTEHTPDPITPLSPRLPQSEGQSLPGAREAALALLLAAGAQLDALHRVWVGASTEEVPTLNPNPGTRSPV